MRRVHAMDALRDEGGGGGSDRDGRRERVVHVSARNARLVLDSGRSVKAPTRSCCAKGPGVIRKARWPGHGVRFCINTRDTVRVLHVHRGFECTRSRAVSASFRSRVLSISTPALRTIVHLVGVSQRLGRCAIVVAAFMDHHGHDSRGRWCRWRSHWRCPACLGVLGGSRSRWPNRSRGRDTSID